MKKYSATSKKPASRSVASSSSRLRGIDEATKELAIQGGGLAVWLVKLVVVGGIGYYLYSRYTNRFSKLKENSNYPISNISMAQAQTRADAIYSSIGWFSNSFDTVTNNITGLNYNGFIRLYNAFGHHSGTFFSGDLNLIEWVKNQFSEEEVQSLSFLTNGVFFKGSNDEAEAIQQLFNQFPKRIQ